MSKHITQKNDISTYLEFSNLQIASEAFIGKSQLENPGTIISGNKFERNNLIKGNDHTSKFTETAADEFMQHWRVVEHITNTKTGFSGTLFEALENIPGAGVKAGDQVLSFRSTEFVDDEVRDSQATNSMEISDRGFAFGQISDLRDWVGQMRAKNLMKDHISVTGYSLGGHLATAFYKLNEEGAFPGLNIDRTYTFNGAGIGKLKDPKNMTLKEVLNQFKSIKENGANEVFKTELGKKTYQEIKEINDSALNINKETSEEEFQSFIDSMKKILADKKKDTILYHNPASPELQKILNDINILENAIERISDINKEILRIKNFTDTEGSSNKVYNVKPKDVASLSIDYQIALGLASNNTESYGVPSGANRIWKGDKFDTELKDNFYDIMGDTYPSMVALSQKHFGKDIRISIEDQPLFRGDVIANIIADTREYSNLLPFELKAKLFVDHYKDNDFGDTHSIVLLTDSLATQELLQQLDSNFSYDKFKPIFKLASNIKSRKGITNDYQGIAEGDALENIINSISNILNIKTTHLFGNILGGTWADIKDRNTLHKTLKEISDEIEKKGVGGKFNITDSNNITPDKARNDFGYFLALKQLSPVVLSTENNTETFWKESWPADYEAWQNDKFTDNWINDKKGILDVKNLFYNNNYSSNRIVANLHVDNDGNISVDKPKNDDLDGVKNDITTRYINYLSEKFFGLPTYNFELIDKENNFSVEVSTGSSSLNNNYFGTIKKYTDLKRSVQFGSATGDTLTGYNGQDHLYGSAEADTLEGKEGDDYLEGKEGHDTYKLTSNGNGVDTIFDSDGDGVLEVDGTLLSRLEFVSTPEPFPSPMNMRWTPFRTRDGQYQFLKYDDDQWEFSVRNASGNYQPLARIRHWKEGDFGFTLAEDNTLLSDEGAALVDDSGKAHLFFYNGAMAPRGIRVKGSNFKPSQITGRAPAASGHGRSGQ